MPENIDDNIRKMIKSKKKSSDKKNPRYSDGIFTTKKRVYRHKILFEIFKYDPSNPFLYETREQMLYSDEINLPSKFIVNKHRYDDDGCVFYYEIKIIDMQTPDRLVARTYTLDENGAVSQITDQLVECVPEINEYIKDMVDMSDKTIRNNKLKIGKIETSSDDIDNISKQQQRKMEKLNLDIKKLEDKKNMLYSLQARLDT